MASQAQIPENADIELELERIQHSHVFEKAQRSQRFLRYLVEAAVAHPPIAVKEYTIAIDVFDRDPDYDPAVDATVRVEAGRLRSRLRDYYAGEGSEDLVLVDVPKGSYAAVITRRSAAAPLPEAPQTPSTPETLQPIAPASVPGPPPVQTPPLWRSARLLWIGVPATLVCVLLVCTLLLWFRVPSRPHPLPTPDRSVSLAILPITNHTGDPGMDVVADGLTENLIRGLSEVPALKVVARTSVFRYRQPSLEPRRIGQALGVANVMTADLRHQKDASGDHLSLDAELSTTSDGSVLLSRQYILDDGDLRPAQATLQRELVAKLHVETSAMDPSRRSPTMTSSPEAYQEFLAGDGVAQGDSATELHSAIDHFQRAVALDPNFDLAWSDLASAHALLGLFFEPPREHMPSARAFAQRALRLNPALGEAHGTLGLVHLVYDWDFPAAKAEMRWAGAEQAAVAALSCTAHLVERTGDPRNAEEMLGRMLAFDPQSAGLMAELGCVDYYRGHYEAALQHYSQALAANPQSPVPYWGLGKTLNAQRRHQEAIAALQDFHKRNGFEPPLITAEIGYALGSSGQKNKALNIVQDLISTKQPVFVDPYLIATIYAGMGDREHAFLWLHRALDARSSFMISLYTEPKWEPFRSDPRFSQLLELMTQNKAA